MPIRTSDHYGEVERLVTSQELAAYLAVSSSTLRRMIRGRRIPVVRVRGCLRFNIRAVEGALTQPTQVDAHRS